MLLISNRTGSHSFTVPAGITTIAGRSYGGGGGGSGGSGGGGGGAMARTLNITVVPAATVTYVIGAGGGDSANGADSSLTTGSLQLNAKGGGSGDSGGGGDGGLASASTGSIKFNGGNAGFLPDGAGGAGSAGAGGAANGTSGGAGGSPDGGHGGMTSDLVGGTAGSNPGGGGGTDIIGGYSGGDGRIRIDYEPANVWTESFTSGFYSNGLIVGQGPWTKDLANADSTMAISASGLSGEAGTRSIEPMQGIDWTKAWTFSGHFVRNFFANHGGEFYIGLGAGGPSGSGYGATMILYFEQFPIGSDDGNGSIFTNDPNGNEYNAVVPMPVGASIRLDAVFDGQTLTTSINGVQALSSVPTGLATITDKQIELRNETQDDTQWVCKDFSFTFNYVSMSGVGAVKSGNNVSVSWSNFSGASLYQLSKDGANFSTQTSPYTDTNATGSTHTYSIRSIDNAGNIIAAGLTGYLGPSTGGFARSAQALIPLGVL